MTRSLPTSATQEPGPGGSGFHAQVIERLSNVPCPASAPAPLPQTNLPDLKRPALTVVVGGRSTGAVKSPSPAGGIEN